jgi:epoxyqueuosine reductase
VARFATSDHYKAVRSVLRPVAAVLRERGFRAECLYDDNRLVDRAAAVRAGVGWWGKNSMVLTPGAGPWILLGSVVTDAALVPGTPMKRGCGTCAACLPACPTGALVAPGILDARLCLAYWLQAPGLIPRALRSVAGDRLYGCDDCIEACPPGLRLLEGADAPAGDVDLFELLGSDDESILAAHSHFYIPDRRARYLRRNALVALGNTGREGALAVLAGYVGHPDWLLRAHAAWALGRRGGPGAAATLEHALGRETDERVREEIKAALAANGGSLDTSRPGLR